MQSYDGYTERIAICIQEWKEKRMMCPIRSSWFRRGLKWKGDGRCIERGALV